MSTQLSARIERTMRRRTGGFIVLPVLLALLVIVGALAVGGHALALTKGSGSAGLWMPLDRGFDLVFTAGLFALSAALGRRLLRALGCGDALDALALGLGTLGTLTLGAGLLGLFNPIYLAAGLALPALWSMQRLIRQARMAAGARLRIFDARFRAFSCHFAPFVFHRLATALVAVLVGLALLRALTPSVESDAVTYHLGLPKIYLEQGRFLPLPHLGGDGYPFTVEMLYLLGLAFGSEIAPRLIHLGFAGLTALALFRFFAAREGRPAGRLAALVFLALPATLPIASWAYVDIAWAAFQVLAVLALLAWSETKEPRLLILAGLHTGFALGTKLLALHLFVVAPLVVAWALWRRWRRMLVSLAVFGVVAVAAGSPWYVKNWLWAGHPLYPHTRATPASFVQDVLLKVGEPPVETASGVGIVPGTGQSPLDYALLPLNVFLRSDAFTNGHAPTVFGPLLVLAPLALALPATRSTRLALAIGALLFVLWGRGYQEARYFLPGAALLAGVAGVALARLLERFRGRPLAPAIQAAVLIAMLLAAYDQAEATLTRLDLLAGRRIWAPPTAFLFGAESRDQFLSDRYPDFAALQYLNTATPADARVLFLGTWAGGYYADRPFLQGSLLDLAWLVPTPKGYGYPVHDGTGPVGRRFAPTMADALSALRVQGITHLFVGKVVVGRSGESSASFALFYQDLRDAIDAGRLRSVYSDPYASILEIVYVDTPAGARYSLPERDRARRSGSAGVSPAQAAGHAPLEPDPARIAMRMPPFLVTSHPFDPFPESVDSHAPRSNR
ncbi:MAG: hypothetical protein HY331_05400 [Chloroflexi bacterium]|nr:hypothetical protein [Chloroflexota bacterium]